MASAKDRATVGYQILKLLIQEGYAKDLEEAKNLYRTLEWFGGAPLDFNDLEGNGLKGEYSLAEIKQLNEKIETIKRNFGVSNLMDYSRLENNLPDDYSWSDLTSPDELRTKYTQSVNQDTTDGTNAKDTAFNNYYNDVMDWQDPNTSAGQYYNAALQQEQNAALEQASLADMSIQQANLQQASYVKQIADQVRNERMARLRAGMSESQIAQQDMQSLMTNIKKLNDNAVALATNKANAQYAYNNAQQTAFNNYTSNYLPTASTAATGMAASDAGDLNQTALNYMNNKKRFGTDYTNATSKVGQN